MREELQCVATVASGVHDKAVLGEKLTQQCPDIGVVVYEKDGVPHKKKNMSAKPQRSRSWWVIPDLSPPFRSDYSSSGEAEICAFPSSSYATVTRHGRQQT